MHSFLQSIAKQCCTSNGVLSRSTLQCIASTRGYKRSLRPTLFALRKRREKLGPDPERPRSVWVNWNYSSEVFSFGKRLGEDFKEDTLRTALVDSSYIIKEQERRKELQVDDEQIALAIEDNDILSNSGRDFASKYIFAYIKTVFPRLPEEGSNSIHDFLMSTSKLSFIGSNLGLKDIILSADDFPNEECIARSFLAVIGALEKDCGSKKAGLFVQDFILTQLHGKELNDIIEWKNPMGILQDILESENMGPPEPRLLWETGSETVMAAYVVGIYSNQQLIGQSAGETLPIAEDMAARDCLRNVFGLADEDVPLKFGDIGHKLNVQV